MLIWLAAFALQAESSVTVPPPVHGGPEQMTCPIGGERFEALVTGHYSTRGARPDGRPRSYWYMPLPLPECPSNGLVIFGDFTPEQIAALTPLIASPDYRRLVAEESSYYRAQWLATRIGLPEREALWLLLSATWQVKSGNGPIGQPMPSPTKSRLYQQEFVARVRALPVDARDPTYIGLYARAANAERELGDYRNAAAMLTRLRAWLANPDPSRWEDEDSAPRDWARFAASLARVVARRDASVDPLDMMDDIDAAWLCVDPELPRTAFNRVFCARPRLRGEIEQARQARGEAERETARQAAPR